MKKRSKKAVTAIVILAIALAIVVGVIIWRQVEYARSAAYYGGLRG